MQRLDSLRESLPTPPLESDATVPVLVLRFTPLPLHHSAVGIIRSLGSMGVPVFGIVEDQFTPAAVSRYLRGVFIWEAHGLDVQHLLEGMALIGERPNRPTIVIPIDDVGAVFIAEQGCHFAGVVYFPRENGDAPTRCLSWVHFATCCSALGKTDETFPDSSGGKRYGWSKRWLRSARNSGRQAIK